MLRLGLTILLDSDFKNIKILEADGLDHFNRTYDGIMPDLLILGNNHRSNKKTVHTIQSTKDKFATCRIIIYDYRRLDNITNQYMQLEVKGHLLWQAIGTEFNNCVRAVQHGEYYVCSAVSGHPTSTEKKSGILPKQTARESVIAGLLMQGKSIPRTASAFERTPASVRTVKRNIIKKTQASSVTDLEKVVQVFAPLTV